MNNAEDFTKYPLDSTSLSNGFSRIWESYGNTSSSELKGSWKVIFETFNKCCIRNVSKSEKKYFVIPAVTGSGKTLCYQWYAAELAKATLSGDIDTPPKELECDDR